MERASVLIRFEVEIDDDGEVVEGRARVVGGDGDRAWLKVTDESRIRETVVGELAEDVFRELGPDLWTDYLLCPSYSLAEYAEAAKKTAVYPKMRIDGDPDSEPTGLIYAAMGLAGEAGEVAEQVKKFMRDDGCKPTEARRQKLLLELGDVLWYVAAVANEIDATLDDVADMNIRKLASRQERGVLGGSGDDR